MAWYDKIVGTIIGIIMFVIIVVLPTPFDYITSFTKAEPGIANYYRRALSKSNDKDHPIFTLVNEEHNKLNGLHSHDDEDIINDIKNIENNNNSSNSFNSSNNPIHVKSNSTNTSNHSNAVNATTVKNNNPSSNKILDDTKAQTNNTTDIKYDLVDDIKSTSAMLVEEWGLGWDSKMARVAQVLLGLGIYYLIMVIKGYIISWGIAQVTRQVSEATRGNSKVDILSNLVNMAVNNLASRFGS